MKWILVIVAVCACSKKSATPAELKIDELGVAITVPSNWQLTKDGGGVKIASGMSGVMLRAETAKITNLDEAKVRLMSGAKIKEQKQLPSGGYLFTYDVEFPGKPPMLLPYVTVLLPVKEAVVRCELQLQPGQEATSTTTACSSMRPL